MKYRDVKSLLPPSQHIHWENFVLAHKSRTVDYVYSLLGIKINEEEFFQTYFVLHPKTRFKNYNSRSLLRFLIKNNWVKQ